MAEKCKWVPFPGHDDREDWGEEECVASHGNSLKDCVRFRCGTCLYPTGITFYNACPNPGHLVIALVQKAMRGEPIHERNRPGDDQE